MRKKIFATIVVLFAVALIVSACGGKKSPAGQAPAVSDGVGQDGGGTVVDDTTPVADANLPEGWSVYANSSLHISIAYPPAWYYRERTAEETGNPDQTWVDFSTDPIVSTPESDAVYHASLIVTRNTTLQDAMADYLIGEGAESQELVTLNGQQFTKLTYRSDLVDNLQVVVYLLVDNHDVYEITGLASTPEIVTMAASLTREGGR